jgi:hypothetical protein
MMISTILLFLECTQKSGSTDFASNPRRRNLQIYFMEMLLNPKEGIKKDILRRGCESKRREFADTP